ncbi:hypothetical protein JVU11DRAFT_10228 [Chiua virens]|nr:hypothetical protein JVU11DRAFT_10228 [Chiua virens]
MGPAQPKPSRKRHRKRKRRVASDSSSSEDDSSSSSSDASTPKATVTIPVRQAKPAAPESVDSDESEDDESSSSDDPQNDSEPDQEEVADVAAPQRPHKPGRGEPPQRDSPSPEPNVDIPPLVTPDVPGSEQVLKEKFRGFWMAAIAEGFKDDLEEIRKEPNLGPSRLALLIESLASGADVFSSSTTTSRANEMEIVLDQLP